MTTLMNWIMMYMLTGVLYWAIMTIVISAMMIHKYGVENVLAAIKKNYRSPEQLGIDKKTIFIDVITALLIWPVAYSRNMAQLWNIVTEHCENNRD